MKNVLLSLTALLIFSTGAMAQKANLQQVDARQYRPKQHVTPIDMADHHFIKDNQSVELSSEPVELRGSGAISFAMLGTSYNIYGILLDEQNQVSYDPDLDAVTFVHRHNDGDVGGSGGLSFDYSGDGGATWSIDNELSPSYNAGSEPDVSGNRYPSISIYNPGGGGDAYVVAKGPALAASTGSWGLEFNHSAKTDGTGGCESYQSVGGDDYDFHPYGLQTTANGDTWAISTVYDAAGVFSPDTFTYSLYRLQKGVFNAGTGCFDWTVEKTITPDWFLDTDVNNATGYGWNIAFGPDGNTGYAVYLGSEMGDAFAGIKPHAYKTTDAGTSWNALPDFDFRTLSAFQDYLVPTSQGDQIPFFTSVDMVVDQNDDLQMFSEVLPRSTSNSDSIYFIWTGTYVTGLFALSTSDGTDWDAWLIDSVGTDDGAVGTVAHGNRTQMSRSADGSKVFYSWAASDPDLVTTNDLPNLWIRGYDPMTGDLTFSSNVTEGTAIEGIVYFPTMAPIVKTSGTEHDYEVQVAFAEPGGTDLDPPQYWYIGGAGFDDADFGVTAPPAVAGFTWDYPGYGGLVQFTNTSSNADSYLWDFDDASSLNNLTNPAHQYAASGVYNVCLTATNTAGDNVLCQDVDVVNVGIESALLDQALVLFPTPSSGIVNVSINSNSFSNAVVEVYNMLGELVIDPVVMNIGLNSNLSLNLSDVADGQYFVKVQADNGLATRQITIAR